jgi:formate dehydrogenase major subunit
VRSLAAGDTLQQIAKELAEARSIAVLWVMCTTQHMRASDGSTAISNLLLITGNYMRLSPACHNNLRGAGIAVQQFLAKDVIVNTWK